MRSSEYLAPATALALAVMVGALALPGCTAPGQPAAPQVRAEAVCLRNDGAPDAARSAASLLFEQQTRSQPLFLALAPAGVRTCRLAGADDGESSIEFSFGNGATLSRSRDPRIEYAEQRAQFSAAPYPDAMSLLRDAEQAAFPPKGCGIDWGKPETLVQGGAPAITASIYRGQRCSCMAMVQRQTGLAGATLVFRSTC